MTVGFQSRHFQDTFWWSPRSSSACPSTGPKERVLQRPVVTVGNQRRKTGAEEAQAKRQAKTPHGRAPPTIKNLATACWLIAPLLCLERAPCGSDVVDMLESSGNHSYDGMSSCPVLVVWSWVFSHYMALHTASNCTDYTDCIQNTLAIPRSTHTRNIINTCIVVYWIVLYCIAIVLHSIALYCSVLPCIVVYWCVLYCMIFHCIVFTIAVCCNHDLFHSIACIRTCGNPAQTALTADLSSFTIN